MKSVRTRRCSTVLAVIGIVTLVVSGVGCSSSSSSSTKLTKEQRAELGKVAAAYDAAEASVTNTFEAAVVVPKLENWQNAEYRHQEALGRLRDGLPAGACRSAIEALLVVEDGQNVIRLRLIDDYRKEQFSEVAKDTVAYGASVINGAYQAEDAVAVACGRSSVDPTRVTDRAASLTAPQNALFDSVLAAYDATRVAFDASFSIARFVTEVEALQNADVAVDTALDESIAMLADGTCKDSLREIRRLEQQQTDLRSSIIAAGKAGDAVKMFTLLNDYTAINSTSEPFMTARTTAAKDCGADV